ncbi:outer membrane beta-barrel protein [Spirosoma foliorum]|uniref:Porin family protein n=1 Tax=Spirosoma foliorum TaxID=2710596 RepID=A0A7G5GYY4_9BACT|nr:outer membrane beta-barrel protein [Spirosoma foliorum]QMW04076.1 porin family protein [Spirosoma foliorum]
MKNLICIVLLVFIQISAKAQTEKGRWNAGFSVGQFSYQKNDLLSGFSGSISPTAGYFVARNFLIGTGIPISYSSTDYSNLGVIRRMRVTSIGVSPFARYYIGASKLKPYVGIAYTYSHSNYHEENSQTIPTIMNDESTSASLTPSLGLAYFINRSISLDAQLGYNFYSSKASIFDSSAYNYRVATLGIGFNIFFGS